MRFWLTGSRCLLTAAFIDLVNDILLYRTRKKPTKKSCMEKIIQFGETVPGYPVAVLNEREIRASAGILFLIIFIGLMLIIFNGDFLLVKYTVTVFLMDFIIRVLINPKYAPSLIIGRLIVRNQTHSVSVSPRSARSCTVSSRVILRRPCLGCLPKIEWQSFWR